MKKNKTSINFKPCLFCAVMSVGKCIKPPTITAQNRTKLHLMIRTTSTDGSPKPKYV